MHSAQVLVGLANARSGASSAATLRQSVPEKTVVGIFRDLRGIAMATNSRRTYGKCVPVSKQSLCTPNIFCLTLDGDFADCFIAHTVASIPESLQRLFHNCPLARAYHLTIWPTKNLFWHALYMHIPCRTLQQFAQHNKQSTCPCAGL